MFGSAIMTATLGAAAEGLPQAAYGHMADLIGEHSAHYFIPELIVCAAILAVLLIDTSNLLRKPWLLLLVAVTGLLAPIGILLGQWGTSLPVYLDWGDLARFGPDGATPADHNAVGSMLLFDGFGTFFKIFVLASGVLTIGMITMARNLPRKSLGEMMTLLLGSILGMMLLSSASNLLMIYLSIELMSLASFILVAFRRKDKKATEGALKYMLFGAVSSGVMIYGISLLYGMTGTLNLALMGERLAQVNDPLAIGLSLLMVTVGFGYKMSIVPMHFWAPDAYEGASTPVTAFLSVASKAAGFAVFVRFLDAMVGHSTGEGVPVLDWVTFAAVLGGLTMTVGNLTALWQKNVKRMLAYSSVAHAGYLMIGAAAVAAGRELGPRGTEIADLGASSTAFYLVAYCVMNFGAFSVLQIVANETGSEEMSAFNGLGKRNLTLAVAMVVLLLSLLGVPPTFGFLGKMQLFMAGIEGARAGYTVLAVLLVVAAVNTAVSAYYYFRIIKAMFLTKADEAVEGRPLVVSNTGWVLAGGMAVLTVVLFVAGSFFSGPAEDAKLFRAGGSEQGGHAGHEHVGGAPSAEGAQADAAGD